MSATTMITPVNLTIAYLGDSGGVADSVRVYDLIAREWKFNYRLFNIFRGKSGITCTRGGF
jgi:hypothetical protein